MGHVEQPDGAAVVPAQSPPRLNFVRQQGFRVHAGYSMGR
jgi:hypothetical protein